jgi:hypothetical protein
MMEPTCDPAGEQYRQLLSEYERVRDHWRDRLAALQRARQCLLYVASAAAAAAYLFSGFREAWLGLATLLAASAAVVYHFELSGRKHLAHANEMIHINRQGIARRRRDWDSLAEIAVSAEAAELPLAVDLDLFGKASLMQLICTAETEQGVSTLVRWLIDPSSAKDSGVQDPPPLSLRVRQHVCMALAPLVRWRQELQRRCGLIGAGAARLRQLQQWGSDAAPGRLPSWVRGYVTALPLLAVAGVGVMWIDVGLGGSLLVALVAINIALTIGYSGGIHSHFRRILVTPDAPSFHLLSETFAQIAGRDELREWCPRLTERCQQAVVALRRLERILALESISRHALSSVLVYLPLQLLLLWDLRVYERACQWRAESGTQLPDWFALLGEVEALSSLACLSFEQPGWQFPELATGAVGEPPAPQFAAEGLGHPLLPDRSRVTNDVTVGPPGSLLLVTGSNMGGKSTLLRAIGLNAVLAQAGAPCCCSKVTMSPLRVMTSMRVADSLSDAKSFFVAQLLTLKEIVDEVTRQQQPGFDGPRVMYLLDEILNGTNTTERRIAVEGLVGYLLGCQAIGVMTTHDLEIATASRHRASYRTYYLSHQLGPSAVEPELTFDYKLRPGVSPSSNALVLVRMLGLPSE